jgi:uncharacterized protein (DUF305 family)
MKNKITAGALGVSIVLVLVVGLSTYQKMQSTKKADLASATAEQQFMEQMTSHHMDAIQMAQLAEQKAQTTSVKILADGIIAAQNKEVTEMKTWYKQWYEKDMPEMATMSGMMMNDGMDMNKLSSATDFDLEFVNQMIPHHESAVAMAKAILQKAKHQEIKTLASSIITSQNIEILQMKTLQSGFEKYPVESSGRHALDCAGDSPGSC